jgi:hypothetical protein
VVEIAVIRADGACYGIYWKHSGTYVLVGAYKVEKEEMENTDRKNISDNRCEGATISDRIICEIWYDKTYGGP